MSISFKVRLFLSKWFPLKITETAYIRRIAKNTFELYDEELNAVPKELRRKLQYFLMENELPIPVYLLYDRVCFYMYSYHSLPAIAERYLADIDLLKYLLEYYRNEYEQV